MAPRAAAFRKFRFEWMRPLRQKHENDVILSRTGFKKPTDVIDLTECTGTLDDDDHGQILRSASLRECELRNGKDSLE